MYSHILIPDVEIPVTPNLPIDDLVQQPLVQPPLVKPVSSKTECVNIAKQLGLQVSEETVTAMERAAQGKDIKLFKPSVAKMIVSFNNPEEASF